jgi:hypothetical protein
MLLKRLLSVTALILVPIALSGQGRGLDPAELLKPLGEEWPTYSGDYTGKRYSPLTQIDQTTVKRLTLAWVTNLTAGPGGQGFGFGRRGDGLEVGQFKRRFGFHGTSLGTGTGEAPSINAARQVPLEASWSFVLEPT